MGRRRCKRWNSCLMWFLTSMGALFYTCGCLDVDTDQPEIPVAEPTTFEYSSPHHGTTASSSCPAKQLKKQDFLVLVSTLDGKLSALDIKDKGRLLWSIDADTRPLLSSSISKLEINRDGMRTRLIPSLDGGLYQYDGESIEPIPMTAETLLSSSYKLSDRMVMIGGKDIRTYGVDPTTGQLRYACTSNDCQFFGETHVTDDEDIMVVTRITQTVRAVDSRTGAEKWNFSVGSHALEFLEGDRLPTTRYVDDDDDNDDVQIIPCPAEETEEIDDSADFESSLKIIVPEGMVVSLNPDDPSEFKWQHKFSSPVANAWLLHKGTLKSVSVFDTKHIPALSDSGYEDQNIPRQPLLYVGLHHNQLYVQPSMKFKEDVQKAASKSGTNQPNLDLPRVTWKPYLHTPSRTPLFRGNMGSVPLLTERGEQEEEDATALTVWHENYPFDNGYYLYPQFSSLLNGNESCDSEDVAENSSAYDNVVIVSLFYYWREVVAISIVTSVLVNILLYKLKKKKDALLSQFSCSGSLDQLVASPSSGDINKSTEDYVSRYKTDFEHVQCLGKGGFGIVFEARNKVDDCHYAVKRISLPNRDKAKEKVMREVKALAKLDNTGIVRYFHAWVEAPPTGWQEEQDKQIEDSELTGVPTPCNSVTQQGTSSLSPDKPSSPAIDILNPFGGNGKYDYSLSRNKAAGGSSEFSVNESLNIDDSSSFGILADNLNQIAEEERNLNVHFELSDSEDSGSCSKNIPFKNFQNINNSYGTNNSISIVFEDSGCGDKSEGNSEISEKDCFKNTDFHIDISNSVQVSSINTSSNQKSHSISKKDDDQSEHEEKNSIEETIDQSNISKRSSATPLPKLYLFIQMQLCRRETLKDWLAANNQPREMNVVLDIFDQIVSAVDYVHGCGLMHRDLKPSNIFFSVEGLIKVGDFGLVTALTEQELELCTDDCNNPYKRHTAQVGTQLYMSPEQVSGKAYSHKVDIFSLGVILFELVYPFSTQMERIQTLIKVKDRKFQEKFCKESPYEHKFVEWLLSPDPCDRPSARQILDSDLLKDYHARHTTNRIRHRTTSSSSSGSIGINRD